MKLFNRKKKAQQMHMECPKCGGKMTLESRLSYTFHCNDQEVEVSDIAAMKCADCGEMMFNWAEAQRIEKYVHEAVGWEDAKQ